ncbi:MAG: hypothetical protein HC941_27845, partial [Microcoleus sp. SU_5_3]|nr:hypothetical protein [Microcoleus sp. SU_5_3]
HHRRRHHRRQLRRRRHHRTPTPTPIASNIPGITVSPTSGLATTKTGGKAKFTVELNSPPSADVSIDLSVSPQNPAEGSLSNSKVTFTPENWNIPQEVTVTGQPGTLMMVANRPYTIVLLLLLATIVNIQVLMRLMSVSPIYSATQALFFHTVREFQ